MLAIKDFADMAEFERIMANWATATGLATVAVDANGEYISECYNFTDFCIKLTRGSQEGLKRCVKCDQTGKGVYHCHAGLIDFAIDLKIGDEKVGSVIGGQVLPENPDEAAFRRVAQEIGVDEDKYIEALRKVNVRAEAAINAAAGLLGEVLNDFINASYHSSKNFNFIEHGIRECNSLVARVKGKMGDLNDIQATLSVLALNAKIESAHAGEKGAGFAVVADEVRALSDKSMESYSEIEKLIEKITEIVDSMDKDI